MTFGRQSSIEMNCMLNDYLRRKPYNKPRHTTACACALSRYAAWYIWEAH